jgi:hypothetical protein
LSTTPISSGSNNNKNHNNNTTTMKCIYSVLRPAIEQKPYPDLITNCRQKCSVSSKGLVAFTSSFCLNQPRPQSVSYHVYVADLNRPYQPYLLTESQHKFTIVEWDPSGTKLLLCDSHGCATIYTSKDFLISDWKPYFKHVFAAETFISACWYHPGIISTINVPQSNLKTSSNHLEYSDKIQQNKFSASLRLFGGKAAEGCILVSQTGLVCCLTLMADHTVAVASESLNPLRVKLHVADISYDKDGSFIVGTSSGSINSTISFYRVSLSVKNITLDEVDSFLVGNSDTKRINITSKQFHSFHLNVMSQILNERENTCAFERVNHIKFVSKDSPTDVLIEVSGQNLSLIELWELEIKRHNPVHSAILEIKRESDTTIKQEPVDGTNGNQQQIQPNNAKQADYSSQTTNNSQTSEWSFKGNYITDRDLISIQTPKFRIFGQNRQLNIILLSYEDSTVCCLRKDDLQPIEETLQLSTDVPMRMMNGRTAGSDANLKSFRFYDGNSYSRNGRNITQSNGGNHLTTANLSRPLKHKTNFITDLQLSNNQTVFVAIDSMSQLHVVKSPTLISCQDTRDEETYLQYMLEFCLVTGNDWWDVLVCAKRESIATICDKFHDAYERQPKQIQRKYFNRQLMIRASLYRCLNDAGSLCKSSDCHTMIMLNSIASTHKSMLRSQDQDSPSDLLSHFLKTQGNQPNFFNINNVLAKINEKEFYVETQLIQYLQPLNQWAVDFAIFLIISLPQQIKSQQVNNLPGAGLIKNKEAIETLRELLVIIKIWGKQNLASVPVVYRLNEQLDVIGALFKLISMHYTTMGNNEPDDSLLEECVQLANNITVTHFEYFLSATGVASPYLHSQPNGTRLVMEYFRELNMPELVQLDKVEGCIDLNGHRKIDIVRNISLGAYPLTNVRHCTRCRGISLMRPIREAASFNSARIWEQRWMTTCVCGGHWAQSDGMFSNKMSSLALICNTSNPGALNQLASQLAR